MVTSIIAIRLPAALEKFIASQVREGRYRSREAAIVAAVLHQKQRSEQLAWLRTEIQNGLDSGPAGELNIEEIIRQILTISTTTSPAIILAQRRRCFAHSMSRCNYFQISQKWGS
jgi:putative addiction module CopG family antidote